MSNSFASMYKKKGNDIENIKKKFESLKKPTPKDETLDDETFWDIKHLRGPDGNGSATIRLLPAPDGEDDPFVDYYEYVHKFPNGKWYINKARNSLGSHEADPAYEYNGTLFNNKSLSDEERKKIMMKRRQWYIFNILVISDPHKPENEGKVFKWRVGPQIYQVIDGAMFPQFKGVEPINVFDILEGANFILRAYSKKIAGFDGKPASVPSYEKSEFAKPGPLCTLEEFDEIWNRQYPLKPLVAEDQFKSYAQLKTELDRGLGLAADEVEQTSNNQQKPVENKTADAPKTTAKQAAVDDEIPWENAEESDDAEENIDDWLENFKKD